MRGGDALRGCALGPGERSRSQLLFQKSGPENVLILAVNGLAVNGALPFLKSVKKVSPRLYRGLNNGLTPFCMESVYRYSLAHYNTTLTLLVVAKNLENANQLLRI